jgi:hypothetical protein
LERSITVVIVFLPVLVIFLRCHTRIERLPAGHHPPDGQVVVLVGATRLAEHIGPVARVLVERESREAVSPADLYARLAQHIREPRARRVFMAGSPR